MEAGTGELAVTTRPHRQVHLRRPGGHRLLRRRDPRRKCALRWWHGSPAASARGLGRCYVATWPTGSACTDTHGYRASDAEFADEAVTAERSYELQRAVPEVRPAGTRAGSVDKSSECSDETLESVVERPLQQPGESTAQLSGD